MIVFVYDIDTDELKQVIYDVVRIEKTLLTDHYEISVCDVGGNYLKYIERDKYYLKVV